jgi:hypothetical protein
MTALPNPALSRAVLIGTSVFERLPNLPAVRNNLTELSAALTDARSGILPADNCVVVDSPETMGGFLRRLRTVTRQADDLLLVYYAGHGLRHPTRDLLYLAVEGTDPDEPEGTAVRFDAVREVIEASPARKRLLILDCCYSGMALGAMSAGTIDPREIAVGGTAVITSSPKNKISHSPVGERLTAFSGELIALLARGTPIPGEPLTVDTAYKSLVTALALRHLPEPKLKLTDTSSHILLRRLPASTPVLPPRPAAEPIRPAPIPEPLPAPTPVPPLRMVDPVPVDRPASLAPLLLTLFWRLLLWVCGGLSLALGIGGVAGLLAGVASNRSMNGSDLGFGIGGLVIAVALVFFLDRRRRRIGRGQPTLREVGSPSMAIAVRVLLIVVLLICLGTIAAGLASGVHSTGTPGDLSAVGTAVYVNFFFAEGAVACAYRLFRWSRPDGQGTPPVQP